MLIREIDTRSRPRERLYANGASSLSDPELLAIIIDSGFKGRGVTDIAHELANKFSLAKMSNATVAELCEIKGLGTAKSARIIAALELGKRLKKCDVEKIVLRTPDDVYHYMEPGSATLEQEHLFVLSLDIKCRLIAEEVIFKGTVDKSMIHPREIFNRAIRHNANSIIIVHNHPSGDPTPSKDDIHATEEMIKASRILGIKLLDHVIIGKQGYYSFSEDDKIT